MPRKKKGHSDPSSPAAPPAPSDEEIDEEEEESSESSASNELEEEGSAGDVGGARGGSASWSLEVEAALAALPEPRVARDARGLVVLPESLKAYQPLAAAGTGALRMTLVPTREAYAGVCAALAEHCAADSSIRTQYMGQLQQVKDIDAVLASLGAEGEREHARVQALADRTNEGMESMPGATAEERGRQWAREQQRQYQDNAPHRAAELEALALVAGRCARYAPPEYDTPLSPRLRAWIDAVGGAEELADGLDGQQWVWWVDHPGLPADGAGPPRAPRTLFTGLVAEVCGAREWDEVRGAVLLVAGYLAAQSRDTAPASPGRPPQTDDTNLREVTAAVSRRIDAVAAELGDVEARLRAAGDLATLSAIGRGDAGGGADSPRAALRQDRADVLGRHPEYAQLRARLAAAPHSLRCGDDVSGFYYEVDDELVEALDPVYRPFVEWSRANMAALKEQIAFGADFDLARCVPFQPCVPWLLSVARRVNAPFQHAVRDLLPEWYSGDPDRVPVKGLMRSLEKQVEDYPHTALEMPSAAHLADLVRCLVVCPTAADADAAFARLSERFKVLRVKNGFAPGVRVEFGFRQVLVNILFADDASGLRMVCEVQINLTEYVRVKHMIHRFYSIVRCTKPSELRSLLTKHALRY